VARSIPGYEERAEQVRMALAVDEALRAPRHLVVEAGTGVGKSFAYLVPALRFALETGTKVAVATSTIALQEQLVGKDLPALAAALPFPVSFALVKGRGNFVCRRRLGIALGRGAELFPDPEERAQLEALARFSDAGGASRQELPFEPRADVWEAARAESGNCLHRRCPHYARCGYQEARRRTHVASVLVMNHHVLLADLALRRSGTSFLPEVGAVVVDEAHDLEDTAAEVLGTRLTSRGVSQALSRLWNERRRSGLLASHPDPGPAALVEEARARAGEFFERLREGLPAADAAGTTPVPGPLSVGDDLPRALREAAEAVARGADAAADLDVGRELGARAGALEALAIEVEALLAGPGADQACWAEWDARGNASLTLAPIDVGPLLRERLYERHATVVLTSATLSTGRPPSFRYVRERLGLEDAAELALGSPFDFPRQARIVVRTDVPDPARAPEAYEAALPEAVLDAVRRTRGGAFVLFTSTESMRRTAQAVRAHLEGDGLAVLVQGEALGRTAMLGRFREGGAVLFGVSSFWQGVDVPGDALRNVVIARLPFDVPTHPLALARRARLERAGRSAFSELSLPAAALRLKQGFGRLVRRASDRGIVVLLDSRVVTRRYGKVLLDSLPECPVDLEPETPA
jgi:ATP-dependent DNA helicase DinG